MFISAKHTKRLAFLLLCCSLCSLQDKAAAYAAVKINGYTIEDAFTPPEDETIVYYLNNSSEAYTLVANKVQELWVGEHHRFTVAANKREKVKISWSSSNPEVAEIVKTTGELTALSAGQTVIRMKDSANGVVKKFTLTVKPVPVLPEIPEEWYFAEDYGKPFWDWERLYSEDMSEEAGYSWKQISGVRLVFREEYRDFYEQCSMLRFPEKIDGKRVLGIRLEGSDEEKSLYGCGFQNLKVFQGPIISWKTWADGDYEFSGWPERICPSELFAQDWNYLYGGKLQIPESVVALSDEAWRAGDRQVRISASVKVIGKEMPDDGPFGGLAGGHFCVDGNNTNYYSIFGVLFSYPIHAKNENQKQEIGRIDVRVCETEIGKNALLKYSLDSTSSAYRVPDGIEKIAADAFSGAKFLKKIVLPDSVTELGANAFGGIENDVEIVVPASVTVFEEDYWYTPFGLCPIESDDPYVSEKWNRITIVTPKGSAAEAYAIQYGIKYRNE